MDHKIYYKGNPYTRNNYIPDSALGNRKRKHYLVELPQGEDYFSHSRKKQYSFLHHQSEIRDEHVLMMEQKQNFSHDNLEVSDIEGARPNTLISEALRNRLKSKANKN